MVQGTLLPNHSEVKLIRLRPKDGAIQMEVQGCRADVVCPVCGTASARVHSRYTCRLGDVPWEGLPVALVCSVLFVIALLACFVPASQASRLDPMVAIRSD